MKASHAKLHTVSMGIALAIGTMFFAPKASACNSIGMTNFNYLDRGQQFGNFGMLIAHQTDGNVVIYSNGRAVWNTGTSGRATTRFVFQGDGNLVLSGPNGVVWASGRQTTADFFGVTQPCGNTAGTVGQGIALFGSNSVAYWYTFARFW